MDRLACAFRETVVMDYWMEFCRVIELKRIQWRIMGKNYRLAGLLSAVTSAQSFVDAIVRASSPADPDREENSRNVRPSGD